MFVGRHAGGRNSRRKIGSRLCVQTSIVALEASSAICNEPSLVTETKHWDETFRESARPKNVTTARWAADLSKFGSDRRYAKVWVDAVLRRHCASHRGVGEHALWLRAEMMRWIAATQEAGIIDLTALPTRKRRIAN
jgi:hypothetical protein